ncbi:ATP-dependent DNA ligase (plasmid) [Ralstonia syzygii subsp. celebesensis]|uniref:Putative ATP-dependent DNA ligase from phage n=1 Tax=blood disease bacterium R229 TaxID=741978 RepID=G2ZVZ5_9RALS|nr:ATP-dependent DNA ligase [Ralstonia syzygii]QQV57850.1 ATP-dependent DNA ligase [Ralstonia syzygii subsp. celebesensis]CCA83276.1 putative ATP-dependent DNA ligase from phage [blood disease bacterium R229]
MAEYLIHKAVEFDKVTAKAKKEKGLTDLASLAIRYGAQRKYDGCNGILLVKPNETALLSRTGEVVRSCDHIRKAGRVLMSPLLEKGRAVVLLGEVWQAGQPQSKISGDFRRHDPAPHLQFIAFDTLYLDEYQEGISYRPFAERYIQLHTFLRATHPTDTVRLCETYNPGTYGDPQAFADQLVEQGGYDGLILRDPFAIWTRGSGTGGEILKVKNTETFDLRVIGVEEGKGKYAGTLGALVLRGPKGPVTCSGMSDEQRNQWWAEPSLIVGQIVEVAALGFTVKGSLREPRFKGIRHDKEHADYE